MPDMLVRLYTLPPLEAEIEAMRAAGVEIRRALPPEKHVVTAWVRQHFSAGWASETDMAMSRHPVSCFLATENGRLLGFACYDATIKDFFGPTGVDEAARGRGIGRVLLLACLHDMRAQGYGYAIIGAAGPTEFYKKAVGAIEIEDSWPGVYRGLLTLNPD
ncbi:MAG: GNAT family N-acetyltransferase [Chloroflexi bacterium]|nr:GNAT family N-acetyltransferase [Chloroflexota bacterium]